MTQEETEEVRGQVAAAFEYTAADVGKLIEHEYKGLQRLIQRQTGDIHVAADLLNEAACVAWDKWRKGKIARPAEIGGYIYQVAVYLLRNRRRTVVERPDRRADSEMLDSMATPEQSADEMFDTQTAARVRQIIAGMDSHRDRMVIVRFYLNEEDKEDICRDLGLTTSQFIKILHRARSRLRRLLESQGLKGTDLYLGFLL
jgi:RNA polymerase sigma-70 factor (ECF subfamily)